MSSARPRFNILKVPTPFPSNVIASAALSLIAVMPARTSPKQHQLRSFKRNFGSVSLPSNTAQKQPALSGPEHLYSLTRASVIAAVNAAANVGSTLLKPPSASTHVYLQQYAIVHSRDSSQSPQRPLIIVGAPENSKTFVAVHFKSALFLRAQTVLLSAAAPITVTTIVLIGTLTIPQRSRRIAFI